MVVDRHLDPIAVTLPDDPAPARRGAADVAADLARIRDEAAAWPPAARRFIRSRVRFAPGSKGGCTIRNSRSSNGIAAATAWPRRSRCSRIWPRCSSSRGPAESVTYAETFQAALAIDPLSAPVADLAAAARQAGVSIPEGMSAADRDAWLDLLLAECIQPRLGRKAP